MSDPNYEYKPLIGNEIRLISFRSRPVDNLVSEIVECELIHRSLDEAVEYNALSYTWGDAHITQSILLDGKVFRVTVNLNGALNALSGSRNWSGMYLWIDAIYINQADIAERNKQVLRMKEIYQRANEVLAWLGPLSLKIEAALRKMVRLDLDIIDPAIAEFVKASGSATWEDVLWKCKKEISAYLEPHGPNAQDSLEFWGGMQELYDFPWWSRSWILQEVASAQKLTLVCGKWTGKPRFFTNVDIILTAVRPTSRALHLFNVLRFTKAYKNDGRLLNLLSMTRVNDATDPRDKVYAILGLATDIGSGELTPNYHLSQWEIYLQVARWYITTYNNLEILDHCLPFSEQENLPSWVPSWSGTFGPLCYTEDIDPHGQIVSSYHASRNSPISHTIEDSETVIDDWFLKLRGVCVGTIERQEEYHDLDLKIDDQWSWIPKNRAEIYRLTGETMETAFHRTIVGDLDPIADTRGYKYSHEWKESIDFFDPAVQRMLYFTRLRRYAVTDTGLIGIVTPFAKVGDCVFVLFGGSVCYILRRTAGEKHTLIGDAYYHGVMDGEALDLVDKGEFKIESVVLE